MSELYYFAYGSNLSIKRLQQRVPSASFVTRAVLEAHQLRFHKRNQDGSSKADCFYTGSSVDQLWGALFLVRQDERYLLDLAEGLGNGYELKEVEVRSKVDEVQVGDFQQAFTYYATDIIDNCLPYDWYLNHILLGAEEVGLPQIYREQLLGVPTQFDPDNDRATKERSIHL